MTARTGIVIYGGLKKVTVAARRMSVVRVWKKGFGRVEMKRNLLAAVMALLIATAEVAAGEASTSASAGSTGRGPGTAAATAQYSGDRGFARTDTRSGPVSFGRGIAYSVDRDRVSLSVSQAVAGLVGPAVASSFNLSIDRDGSVSRSSSLSVASGSPTRSATAAGCAGASRIETTAGATAAGHTGSSGVVRVVTEERTLVRVVKVRL